MRRAVYLLARQQAPRQLPRTMRRSLRYGVQVLIDWGKDMDPFRRDQAEITDRIAQVAGRERIEVRYFSESPLDGCGPGPEWTWKPYTPPSPGTTVLVLSDLGMSRRTAGRVPGRLPADFAELSRLLTARRCVTVAMVPLSPRRWPPRSQLRLVAWDRTTAVPALAGSP
jgi:hypothetical protein